jgi:hypothetical protein
MSDEIGKLEDLLDQTARSCLRFIRKGGLTQPQINSLAKWLYGCSNQRHTIRGRIAERGKGEVTKVLVFLGKACETLLEIDREQSK